MEITNATSKYAAGSRVPLFGHADQTVFTCSSQTFVNVPETFSGATMELQLIRFRVEIYYAYMGTPSFSLRLFDPANSQLPPTWQCNFAPSTISNGFYWWVSEITSPFSATFDPWQRQTTLQMQMLNGPDVRLASVVLIVDDVK